MRLTSRVDFALDQVDGESAEGAVLRELIFNRDINDRDQTEIDLNAMGRALDTTLFIKNGPCMAGLGLGGEGYLSYSVATPTGEGVTNPKTFTRVRRCVMVDNLRIY